MRIRRADASLASRQATWIVAMEPWRSLGYQATTLGRYLRRKAREGGVLVAERSKDGKKQILGILVFQPDFLLGNFIALLAVQPDCIGQGIGRALMARIEKTTFVQRRWLYVSSDSANVQAARFYRKLGFKTVARLPGLIGENRTEILLRKPRQPQ
jgi:ribosomal protein S18 acetylase RimI-like enzyme